MAKNAPKEVIVIVGGTVEKPEMVDASAAQTIKPNELASAGSTMQDFCLNLLAGTVAPEWTTKTALVKAFPLRSQKDHKAAAKYLLDTSAATIRAAWQAEQQYRSKSDKSRLIGPTLQAMAKAVRKYNNDGYNAASEATASEISEVNETTKTAIQLAIEVATILNGEGTAAAKIKAITAISEIEAAMKSALS